MLNVLLFFVTYVGGFIQSFRAAPVYAFLVYQAVYFYNPPSRWWSYLIPEISYSFFVVALMGGLYVLNKKQFDKNKISAVPQLKYMIVLVMLFSFASFYAVYPIAHSVFTEVFIKLGITMLIAYKLINTIKQLDYALVGYVYGAWYLSFVAFQVGRNSGNRVEGIGTVDSPDANGTAAALVPAIVICVYYIWVSKGIVRKTIFLGAAAFIANALVLINSRGAFLGAALGLTYFMGTLFFTSVKAKGQKLKVIGVGVLGLIAAVSVMDDSFKERIFSIAEETEVDSGRETGATRTIFWVAAVKMSFDYPLGQGIKGFNYHAPDYIPADVVVSSNGDNSRASRRKSVHSTWFEVLSEVGYPGFIAFLGMLIASFKCTSKVKKKLKPLGHRATEHYYKIVCIEGALISFMVSMSFMNRMRAEVLYWCVLFSACAYNLYVVRKQK